MVGTVEKYGASWRIRWDAGLKPNGKRNQRSRAGFRTKRDAETTLRSELQKVCTGGVADSRLTVGSYLDDWLKSRASLRPTTMSSYGTHIRLYFKPHLGGRPLTSLQPSHLDQMYAKIAIDKPDLSDTTVGRIHATLHNALREAVKRRLINHNPADQVELRSANTQERSIWTPQQLALFLATSASDRLGFAYRLLAMTGLRRGETLGLRWQDVDLDLGSLRVVQQLVDVNGRLHFGPPKTKKGARTLAVDTATTSALRQHRAAQNRERLAWGSAYKNNDLVFTREDGSPVRPSHLTRHMKVLAKRAGLPLLTPHGLRHTHASHALAAGVDLKTVSARLGHSTIALTANTYSHVMPAGDRAAAESVASLLAVSVEAP